MYLFGPFNFTKKILREDYQYRQLSLFGIGGWHELWVDISVLTGTAGAAAATGSEETAATIRVAIFAILNLYFNVTGLPLFTPISSTNTLMFSLQLLTLNMNVCTQSEKGKSWMKRKINRYKKSHILNGKTLESCQLTCHWTLAMNFNDLWCCMYKWPLCEIGGYDWQSNSRDFTLVFEGSSNWRQIKVK